MKFDVDVLIFISFLIINLTLGLLASRGVSTIREYAVGDRKFNTATIVSTLAATWISGEFFFTIISESYTSGISFISVVIFGDSLGFLLVGIIFAPRMAEFLGKLSIAEAMGDLYGSNVRVITAISGFLAVSGFIAVQLKIAGFLLEHVLGVSLTQGTIFAGIIITTYSALGGIKSVTFTDVLQFCTFGVVIPVIAYFLFSSIDNSETVLNTLNTSPLFDYKSVFTFENPQIYYILSLFLWFSIPSFYPSIFQRIAMARNTKQIRNSFIISSAVVFILAATLSWIGILVLSIYPDIKGDDLLNLVISDFHWITGFKGLIFAGIMAMVMSTVDSYINSSSILLVHDLRATLRKGFIKNELFATRVCSALIGIISILFAMRSGSFLELVIWASMFYIPIVTAPFIMSIFGFRSSSKSVLVGMFSGFIFVILWEFFLKDKMGNVSGLIPGLFMNLIGLFAYHYIFKQNGGWIGIKDPSPLIEAQESRKKNFKELCNQMKSFDFLATCRRNTPKNDGFIALLGFFVLISTSSYINILPNRAQYAFLLNILYPLTLCLSSILISYPLWARKLNSANIISLCWNSVMFFVLICFSFLTVLISNFSEMQLMVFMINIVIISVLSSWRWSLFLITIGVVVTLSFYKNYLTVHTEIEGFSSLEFKILYLLLLISGTLIILFKPKQEYQEATEQKVDILTTEVDVLDHKVSHLDQKVDHLEFHAEARKKELSKAFELKYEFLRNLQHEAHTPITGITSMGEALYECYDKLTDEQRKSYLKDIATSSTRLNSYVNNMIDLSKLSSMNYKFKRESINFKKLVKERAEICKKLYSDKKSPGKQEFILELEDNVSGYFDKYYISQVIDNIIINAIQYSKEGKITIRLSQTKGIIKFSVSDEGIGVPKEDLHNIFGAFTVSSKTKTPAGGRGVGLAVCKKIIELNNGVISAQQNKRKGVTFTFTLPKK